MSKFIRTLKQTKAFVQGIVLSIFQENILLRASSLTLTSLLNLVPLIVVVFSAFSMFPAFDALSVTIQNFIFENFMPNSGQVIQGYIQTFEEQAHQLPLMSFVFLFVTVGILMYNIESHLNVIFRVSKNRRFADSVLLYWGMLTLAPIFLGLSVLFSSYVMSLEFFSGEVLVGMNKMLILLPPLSAFLAFLFLYMTVPNSNIHLKHASIGAFLAMLLFESAKVIFALYLKGFSTYALLYGALGVIPIFMLWVYFSWVIFLIGALVTSRLKSLALMSLGN
jgi:membrane protein